MASSEWSTLSPLKRRWQVSLSGEHNLSGSIHLGLPLLAAGLHRLPHLCVDVVKGAEESAERRGVVIGVEHLHGAPHMGSVPAVWNS